MPTPRLPLSWHDVDNDGMDGRQSAIELRRAGGLLIDQYTGQVIHPDEVDVDHVLPRARAAEIYKNGPQAWREFVNWPGNLAITTHSLNRSKGARAPWAWWPPMPEARKWFARRWLAAAHRFNLTPTEAETAALARLLLGEEPT
jgi:hypothetical protein